MNIIVNIEIKDCDNPEDASNKQIKEHIGKVVPMMMKEFFDCEDFTHNVTFDGDDVIVSVKGRQRYKENECVT